MSENDSRDPQDVTDGLAAVVALRRLADLIESAQVDRALREGWSWSEVAEALGVTRQAVHKKHARRVAAAGPVRAARHAGTDAADADTLDDGTADADTPDDATVAADADAPHDEPEEEP